MTWSIPSPERLVVVGGGLAGFESITALRAAGYRGRLTLVSAERRLPYDRPPLSKEILRGDAHHSAFEADWPSLEVEILLGCRATGLAANRVETDRGGLDFDGLVIATGSTPALLPGVRPSPRVRVLRTMEDALALRGSFRPGARVAIVGAGWIGAEVATAAAEAGCEVSVIEAADTPLAAALGPEIGGMTEPWYREAGIDLRLSTPVAGIADGEIALADGRSLAADCVVVGIGVRPATDWLRGSGVELSPRGHVRVDPALRTTLPGVVAVGDCAAWPSRLFGTTLNLEHWDNALRAPAVAAATLLGQEQTYDPVPYFWSDQFGRSLQSGPVWSACWTRQDRLVALLTVGRPRDIAHARKVIGAKSPIDIERLRDAEVRVIDAVAS